LKVTVIGAGYVGLTTALALAYIGHDVAVVEKDREKLEILREGRSPLYEKGLDELLKIVREDVFFTENLDDCVPSADIVMIAVGTPAKKNGEADLSYVEQAVKGIAESLRPGGSYTIVIKSTVPVGTNEMVSQKLSQLLNQRNVSCDVHIVSNPEFLREGMALQDTFYPERIVVGTRSRKAISDLQQLYQPITQQTFTPPEFLPRPNGLQLPHFIIVEPASAEMIKYAANAFLALKISFINEIAGLCEKVGADITDVAKGIGTDKRIGNSFLNAGIGWGGSCFPKDTLALLELARQKGYAMPIVAAAREVNYRMRKEAVAKLRKHLGDFKGKKVAVLGLAFKPGTDDLRDAPALDIIRELLAEGAEVSACDPVALRNARKAFEGVANISFFEDPYEAALGADAVVLATEWPQWANIDFGRLRQQVRNPLFFDGRNFFNPDEVFKSGFQYLGVGR